MDVNTFPGARPHLRSGSRRGQLLASPIEGRVPFTVGLNHRLACPTHMGRNDNFGSWALEVF